MFLCSPLRHFGLIVLSACLTGLCSGTATARRNEANDALMRQLEAGALKPLKAESFAGHGPGDPIVRTRPCVRIDGSFTFVTDGVPPRVLTVNARSGALERSVTLAVDRMRDIYVSPRGDLAFVRTDSGSSIHTLTDGALKLDLQMVPEPSSNSGLREAKWSPDGRFLLIPARKNKWLLLYDAGTDQVHALRQNRLAEIQATAWRPDSSAVAVMEGLARGKIAVVDALPDSKSFGEVTTTLSAPDVPEPGEAVWADAKRLIVAGDNKLNVIDVPTGVVLGGGLAYVVSDITHTVWHFSAQSGRSGSVFTDVFGFPAAGMRAPVPRLGDGGPTMDYLVVDEHHVLLPHGDYRVLTDRAGKRLATIYTRDFEKLKPWRVGATNSAPKIVEAILEGSDMVVYLDQGIRVSYRLERRP